MNGRISVVSMGVLATWPWAIACAQSNQQSLNDAWWTGSVQAAGAATLPAGHVLFEPYFYDVITSHSNTFTLRTYLIYGLLDRVSVGVIPIVAYAQVNGGPSSSGPGLEDLTAQVQYRLTSFHPGSLVPTTSFLVQETFPTGRYDRLGDQPSNGFGAGAYATTVALYSQTYIWMPTGRILRARVDVQQTVFSTRVPIAGVSVYGTPAGFRGHAMPGASTFVDVAGEYSLTRRWVLALDVNYGWNGDTRMVDAATLVRTGVSQAVGFTPAIEYNWNANVGVIGGARLIEIGQNTTRSITPVLAVNVVL
jgi:hypothetical protein